ncbi:hypothetical protein I203_103745 [Kwoniella mangroviensis CBS 8507]|uniref:uncharacterized protein n=1 Tax=Kwoniella mangroviensis CBS 8507 TaxID=1296122 RepID=UPI00080CEB8C|nr:uncharacterized protein I203_04160 [Kwoniella mangroviensis CBS 8507]OCF66584.1 hypothetical protein I203_04160 [Kwoniella mangroviensis CBS 8507]
MTSSKQRREGRWITTLPVILASFVAAAPLPNDPSTPAITSPTSYVAFTDVGTTRYTSAPPTIITATPTALVDSSDTGLPDSSWNSYPTAAPAQVEGYSEEPSVVPVIIQPGDTSNDAYALSPTQTASWVLPPMFSDMSPFQVSSYAAGKHNMAILQGSPATVNTTDSSNPDGSTPAEPWDPSQNALQILYPSGSINPGNKPQGGAEFYAAPLDITRATNASLEYSVYFPPDFDFVKGGKLPGLYGGHKGCSGGNAAEDCFSTRLMWRAGGQGELYLYAPKDKQTPSLCQTPPKSICDAAYGLSIGRGAWKFALGDWTTVRQDVWLNTPGQNDGGFNIWVNGQLILSANDVRYRENGDSCIQGEDDGVSTAMINTIGFGQGGIIDNSTVSASTLDEDWQVSEEMVNTSTSTITSTSTSTTMISTVTVTATMPPISTYYTPYTPSSTITSPASASTAPPSRSALISASPSTGLRKRDDPSSQVDAPSMTEHAVVITIPITDAITTVTAAATPTTAFITVPTTNTITSEVPVTITPSASVDTIFNTVYITQPNTITVASSSSSSSDGGPSPSPSVNLSDKSIVIHPEPVVAQQAYEAQSQGQTLQPVILKSPPGQVMKSPDEMKNHIQSQTPCGVGFIGLFFSTFFGGHTSDWASPKDQYTYYRDFKMWINS